MVDEIDGVASGRPSLRADTLAGRPACAQRSRGHRHGILADFDIGFPNQLSVGFAVIADPEHLDFAIDCFEVGSRRQHQIKVFTSAYAMLRHSPKLWFPDNR